MTFLIDEQALLPTDTKGRVRVPAGRREALLDEFEKSGMSARKFARLAGVNEVTFSNWNIKRRKAREKAGAVARVKTAAEPIRLIEAVAEEPAAARSWTGALVVELAGGARVQVNAPGQLAMVAELVALIAEGRRGRLC